MPAYQPRVEIASSVGDKLVINFDDEPLSSLAGHYGNNVHAVKLLASLWVSLLADTPVDPLSKPFRLYRAFSVALMDDFLGTVKRFASLYDELTTSVRLVDGSVSIDFFVEGFRDTPIFFEYMRFFKTRDASVFKYISSFLLFGKKAYYEDESFNSTAFRGWLDVERRLEGVTFDHKFLSDLHHIVEWIMRDFDDGQFLPKHGSGSVAERGVRTPTEKNSQLDMHTSLTQILDRPDVLVGPNPSDIRVSVETAKRRVSRLKFVPKDIGKSRSICMEPAALQWTQQGVRLWIEQALASTMRDHIPLRNQEQNRELARLGSVGWGVDTIDLSSASDSVHIDLIRSIMPLRILRYLEETRSTVVDTGQGGLVEIHKFAPMGSALCFPIQSLVYTAIVLYASFAWRFGMTAEDGLDLTSEDLSMLYNITYSPAARFKLRPFSVYGDDIICDSRITHTVIELLTSLGFSVNTSKSFTGDSAFRESCGGFYLAGFDVTPIRAKLGEMSDTVPMSTIASLIELANRAGTYGYTSLRRQTIRACLYLPIRGAPNRQSLERNHILFSDDPDMAFALFAPKAANKHLRVRRYSSHSDVRSTCFRFQRDEVRSLVPGPDRYDISPSEDDWYRHLVWWRAHIGVVDDISIPDRTPTNVGPRWRWTSHFG